jgi:hypothetical protein
MGGVTALREFIWGYTTLAANGNYQKVSSMKPRGTVVASIVGYVEINCLLLQKNPPSACGAASIVGYVEINCLLLQKDPRSRCGAACVVGYLDFNFLILKHLKEGLRCRDCYGIYSGIS